MIGLNDWNAIDPNKAAAIVIPIAKKRMDAIMKMTASIGFMFRIYAIRVPSLVVCQGDLLVR